jgi:hypothetical protein
VSEIKTVEVDQECYSNPIYLRWLNSLGGFDYWLFHTMQNYKDTTSNEQVYEKYTEDLGSAEGRGLTMSKDNQGEITLGAEGLTKDQAQGLKYLLRSVKVYMLLDAETNAWVVVRVKPDSYDYDKTDEMRERIELTILPPQDFNQQQ